MDRHVTRRLAGASTVGVLLLALAAPASAHVFVSDGATVTGGGFGTEFALMVPHGCAGAATTAIEVQIPDGAHRHLHQVVGRQPAGHGVRQVLDPRGLPGDARGGRVPHDPVLR